MPIYKSQAKLYKNSAMNLVMEICYRDVFNSALDHYSVRKARGQVDYESDHMRNIFFRCDGMDYTIRLWSIIQSAAKCGRTKIDYSVFQTYNCNDCDEEYQREFPEGLTRCAECAQHYKMTADASSP